MEEIKRSVIKAITWRITGSTATLMISYAATGSIVLAGSIAIVQLVANTILYILHERVWDRISWARHYNNTGE